MGLLTWLRSKFEKPIERTGIAHDFTERERGHMIYWIPAWKDREWDAAGLGPPGVTMRVGDWIIARRKGLETNRWLVRRVEYKRDTLPIETWFARLEPDPDPFEVRPSP